MAKKQKLTDLIDFSEAGEKPAKKKPAKKAPAKKVATKAKAEKAPVLQVAPKKSTKGNIYLNRNSSGIESPCKVVWDIADGMAGEKRKDIIAACVKAGVTFYTATTQYQLYFQASKAS